MSVTLLLYLQPIPSMFLFISMSLPLPPWNWHPVQTFKLQFTVLERKKDSASFSIHSVSSLCELFSPPSPLEGFSLIISGTSNWNFPTTYIFFLFPVYVSITVIIVKYWFLRVLQSAVNMFSPAKSILHNLLPKGSEIS